VRNKHHSPTLFSPPQPFSPAPRLRFAPFCGAGGKASHSSPDSPPPRPLLNNFRPHRLDPIQNLLAPALFDCFREKTRSIPNARVRIAVSTAEFWKGSMPPPL
jgi:hypothetical protein